MMRTIALESQGVTLLQMGTFQLFNGDAFEAFALLLASRLGRRIRARSGNYREMRRELRKVLESMRDFAASR